MSRETALENEKFNLSALRRAVQIEETRVEGIVTEKRKEIEEYKALIQRLDDLPKKLRHDIMVPIGSVGFWPGQIVKTNEVLMLIGDGWFVERSCYEANECLNRRLDILKAVIADCDKETKLLQQQLQYAEELFVAKPGENELEIREAYNEEKEIEFKRNREENRKRLQQSAPSTSLDQNDLMQHLDKLLLQEIENCEFAEDEEVVTEVKPPPGVSKDEFNRLIARLDEETSSEGTISDEEEQEVQTPGSSTLMKKGRDDVDSDDLTEDEEEKLSIKEDKPKEIRKRSVTFAQTIQVAHDIRTDEPVTAIKTAIDLVHGKTSSILRNKDVKSPCDEDAIAAIKEAENKPRVVPSSQSAFSGLIVERCVIDPLVSNTSTNETESTKPVSKFKKRRGNY